MSERQQKESAVFQFNSVVKANCHTQLQNKGDLSAVFKRNGKEVQFTEDKLKARIELLKEKGIEPDESTRALAALENRRKNNNSMTVS